MNQISDYNLADSKALSHKCESSVLKVSYSTTHTVRFENSLIKIVPDQVVLLIGAVYELFENSGRQIEICRPNLLLKISELTLHFYSQYHNFYIRFTYIFGQNPYRNKHVTVNKMW